MSSLCLKIAYIYNCSMDDLCIVNIIQAKAKFTLHCHGECSCERPKARTYQMIIVVTIHFIRAQRGLILLKAITLGVQALLFLFSVLPFDHST